MAEKEHSCRKCRDWMVDSLYPEDLERMPAEMEAHVRECESCAEELESLRKMLTAIRKVDLQIKPPPRLESSIMSAIEREVRSEREARPAAGFFDVFREKLGWLVQATRPLVANPAFAAAMLVLVVGGFLLLMKDTIWKRPLGTPAEERSIVLPPVGGEETAAPAYATAEQTDEAERMLETGAAEKTVGGVQEETKEEREKDWAAGMDGDEGLKKTPGGGQAERAAMEEDEDEEAFAKNMAEDQKVTGKTGDLGGYETSTGTLKAAESGYPFKDKNGIGTAASGEGGAAGILQDMPDAAVSTKGKGKTDVDSLDETLTEKKPASKTTTFEGETAYGGSAAKGAPPPTEGKAVATPAPAPSPAPSTYPFGASSGPTDADKSSSKPKKQKKSSTYWKDEEAPEEPSYGAADDLSSVAALEEEAAESEVYSSPAKAGGKKESGGWLAKYKAKKEAKKAAKKAAKAKKDEAKEVSGAAAAEAPATAAQAPKEEKAAKDPYVQARDYYQSGDYDAALKVLNSVLKNPSSTTTSMAYIHHLLGKVWNKKGDKSKALAYYETIFSKYPSYAYIDQARWEAALLYIAKGEKSAAKKLLEKLLSSPQFKEKAQKKLDQL